MVAKPHRHMVLGASDQKYKSMLTKWYKYSRELEFILYEIQIAFFMFCFYVLFIVAAYIIEMI